MDKSDATYSPPSEFILKYVPPVEVWSMEYVISPIKKGYHWISSLTGFLQFFSNYSILLERYHKKLSLISKMNLEK